MAKRPRTGNPQKEDGFFPIANEIAEQMARTTLSAGESKILWAILRNSYGWQRKEVRMSYNGFARLTGLHRRNVQKVIVRLVDRNIITKREDGYINVYSFQKRYHQWKDLPQQLRNSSQDGGELDDTSGGVLDAFSGGVLDDT